MSIPLLVHLVSFELFWVTLDLLEIKWMSVDFWDFTSYQWKSLCVQRYLSAYPSNWTWPQVVSPMMSLTFFFTYDQERVMVLGVMLLLSLPSLKLKIQNMQWLEVAPTVCSVELWTSFHAYFSSPIQSNILLICWVMIIFILSIFPLISLYTFKVCQMMIQWI